MHGLNLMSYNQSSLVSLEVEFRFNPFTLSKYVTIYPDAHHSLRLNTENIEVFNVEKGKQVDFNKTDEYGNKEFIFKCALSKDGKRFTSLERINLISKFLGRSIPFYRLASIDRTGLAHIVLFKYNTDAEYIFERQLEMANEYYNNSNTFDRFMKKYFSFYK